MQSYWHPGAQWLGSPNFTPDRNGHDMAIQPAYVVLHTMVGTIGSANARFEQASEQASATYGVGSDGRLVQWVDEKDAAWADGATGAGGVGDNLDSISIEHEDGGQPNAPRPDALYAASAALVHDVCTRYGIPIDRQHVLKHLECAGAATSCPDALDIDRIVAAAAAGGLPQEDDMARFVQGTDDAPPGGNGNIWLTDFVHKWHVLDPALVGAIGSALPTGGAVAQLPQKAVDAIPVADVAQIDIAALVAALLPHLTATVDVAALATALEAVLPGADAKAVEAALAAQLAKP